MPDPATIEKANQEGIVLLSTPAFLLRGGEAVGIGHAGQQKIQTWRSFEYLPR